MTGKKYLDKGWLNQRDMAAACGLSLSGFMKWNVPPVAKIGREVFYSPGDVTENRLRHDAAMREKKAGSASGQNLLLRQEKLRLMQLQTEAQQLKNKRLREELIDVDVLRWTLAQAGKHIAEIFGEIPERLREKCPWLNATNHATIQREVEKCQRIALEMAPSLDLDQFERNTER